MTDIFYQLEETIRRRLNDASSETSYVAQLGDKGLNKILEKVGEEAIETIIAAKDVGDSKGRDELVNEVSDLIFHILVMLGKLGIPFDEVTNVLEKRTGISGIDEKAARRRKE